MAATIVTTITSHGGVTVIATTKRMWKLIRMTVMMIHITNYCSNVEELNASVDDQVEDEADDEDDNPHH